MYTTIGPGAPLPLTNVGGFAIDDYWSSTEVDDIFAWNQDFTNGFQNLTTKNVSLRVRAVRGFKQS